MELTVRKDDLNKGLATSQSVVERRSSMPILSNVLLAAHGSRLKIAATDLEINYKGFCAAEVSQPGTVTVPARKLYEIVKELPGQDVYLKQKENNYLHLTAGRASYDLVGLPAEDFPEMPKAEGMGELRLEAEVLGEMIEKTIFSISQEDTRFNLAGLYVERRELSGQPHLRFVSTDGHRLCIVDRQVEGLEGFRLERGVIIPRKGVAEMRRLAEEGDGLTLGLNQSFAMLKRGDTELLLRLQEGTFPEYDVVIPKSTKAKAVVNRQVFGEVLRRVSILSADRFHGVRLDFKEGLLEVVSQNPDLGEARETLEVDYNGNPMITAFNARYFIDLCSAMRSEEVTLAFVDDQNPCVVQGEADEGFLSVLMPMRL